MDDRPAIAALQCTGRRWAIGGRVLRWFTIAVVSIVILVMSTFSSISVCDECGCESHDTDFQIPFLTLTLWRLHSEKQTPVSALADELGLATPHPHHWRFVHGGGNGIVCALGSGGDILQVAHSEDFIAFVRCTQRFRGVVEARAWIEAGLDEKRARAVRQWLSLSGFSESRFPSVAEYDGWRQRLDRIGVKQWPELAGKNLLRP
jgi:hypothetical protein